MYCKCFLISLSKQSISLQRISNSLNKWITLLNCLIQSHHKVNSEKVWSGPRWAMQQNLHYPVYHEEFSHLLPLINWLSSQREKTTHTEHTTSKKGKLDTTKNHASCGVYFCILRHFQTSLFTRTTLFKNVIIPAATKYNMAFSCQTPLQTSLYTLYEVAF